MQNPTMHGRSANRTLFRVDAGSYDLVDSALAKLFAVHKVDGARVTREIHFREFVGTVGYVRGWQRQVGVSFCSF